MSDAEKKAEALRLLDYVRQCLELETEGEPIPDDALSSLADVIEWVNAQ